MIGKKSLITLSMLLLVTVVGTACGGQEKPNSGGATPETTTPSKPSEVAKPAEVEIKPFTLKIYAGMKETEFKDQVLDPMSKKYPQVKIEKIEKTPLDQLLATDNTPDILITPKDQIKNDMMKLNLQFDLTPMIKKYNYDLKRFDAGLMDSIVALSGNGQVYGLPDKKTIYGMVYNKDIFDKFGVPAPQDNMTWDDTIQLAKKVSRTDSGIEYHGLDFNNMTLMRGQLELPITDKSGKATVSSAKWQTLARTYQSVFQIPGNNLEKAGYDVFLKDRTTAMFATGLLGMINRASEVPDLNWNLVTFPTFTEAPNMDPQADGVAISIASTSKYKDEAFQIIQYLLSDEVQTALVRGGFVTPLASQAIWKQLGADEPIFKGKNLEAAFKHNMANLPVGDYDYVANPILNKTFSTKIKTGAEDFNTALREAEDAINKAVAEEKAK
ncbi:MAG: transporter substrate-binding protein [Paenibacillaceae bacterium]|jgi:multiple sugar transport system substrate-binding protein|nr:transporter substrate-binding protein [Paenibacillaceae bacterium]